MVRTPVEQALHRGEEPPAGFREGVQRAWFAVVGVVPYDDALVHQLVEASGEHRVGDAFDRAGLWNEPEKRAWRDEHFPIYLQKAEEIGKKVCEDAFKKE